MSSFLDPALRGSEPRRPAGYISGTTLSFKGTGDSYTRGFRSVALLLRCAGLVVGLALSSVATAQLPEDPKARLSAWSFVPKHITNAADVHAGHVAECQTTPPNGSSSVCVFTEHADPQNYYPAPTRHWCLEGQVYHDTGTTYRCDIPHTECPLDAGTSSNITSGEPLGSSTCYENCLMTTRGRWPGAPWVGGPDGRTYWYIGTSTGEYCETPSGAEPSAPFENYTDEDGCYQGFDGRYCPSGGDDCPNRVTAGGGVYCRMPPDSQPCNEGGGPSGDSYCGQDDPNYEEPSDNDGNADSDGDGIINADDPAPDDPDADGDGTPDGEQDGDGNGIPDGEPGGIEDDGDGDSGNGEQGSHDGGTCEKDERKEPDCSDDMDPTRCALAIELFHVRCDQELWRDDLKGTEEFNEDSDGDSLLDDSNEKNKVKKADIDVSEYFDGFDDSGFLQGSSSAPVLDFQFYGKSYQFDMTPFWDLAGMLGYLILAMAYFWAARIVAEGI